LLGKIQEQTGLDTAKAKKSVDVTGNAIRKELKSQLASGDVNKRNEPIIFLL